LIYVVHRFSISVSTLQRDAERSRRLIAIDATQLLTTLEQARGALTRRLPPRTYMHPSMYFRVSV
jgi:hypothetical protein